MINKRSELVEELSLSLNFDSLGQNKAGISPGIANKKGTFLWDNDIDLDFCFRVYIHTFSSSILLLKLSWSLFLAKIYKKISGNRFRMRATSALQRIRIHSPSYIKFFKNLKVLRDMRERVNQPTTINIQEVEKY